ncbi:MAG: Gx transporter family protein [Deltaproteobacteria bacterium]|nr:Gx transporter family protein [Deltaproteobacteria bacterium]
MNDSRQVSWGASNMDAHDRIYRLARLSLLLALATVIHTAEGFLPVTFAWFRFGFANVIGLATLCLFGFKDAFFVTLGRIFLGSLIGGLFGSPAFLLSLSGGTSAIIVMGLAHRWCSRMFSEIGISVLGAVVHNSAQLVVAYLAIVRNEGIILLLPVMIITAVGTGFLNGLAARLFLSHFKSVDDIHG